MIGRATMVLAMVAAGPPIRAGNAQVLPAAANPEVAAVAEASRRFGIPTAWISAVMRAESGGDAHAVSRAGAMGLMQLMPATWAALRQQLRLGDDPFDVRDNVLAGAAYLRAMLNRYGSSTAMLAAYNAGPGRYDGYRYGARPLPPETIAYVAAVAPCLGSAAAASIVSPSPIDPQAWRQASLFTGQAAPNVSSPFDREAGEPPAQKRHPDGIFAALGGPIGERP